MRKFFIFLIFVGLIGCNSLRLGSLLNINQLNDRQIVEIKEVTIIDQKGVKFLKDDFQKGSYNSISVVLTKHRVTNEDYRKIKQIIQKYK